jgi:copper transport protein
MSLKARIGFVIALIMAYSAFVIGATPTHAHANLTSSDPAPNTRLSEPPAAIRLTFTEPLEPNYSRITLRGIDGATIETPASTVDPADPYTLILTPAALPDGVYTVAWRALSAADGHVTTGSYAFSIGMATVTAASTAISESVDSAHAAIRALHLVAFALPIGAAAFIVFVWTPVLPTSETRRLRALLIVGWAAWGVALVAMLIMQAQIAADAALDLAQIAPFVTGTAFGRLWLIRAGLWIAFGAALTLWTTQPRARIAALMLGICAALAHSAFSHAAAFDGIAVAFNALHLLGSAVWIGGLVAFAAALTLQEGRAFAAVLIARFSAVARIAVIALIVSGLYAAWLHVGTLDALLTTVYGRALLLKLMLFAPLLGIAALNLLITAQRLRAGRAIWVGRLRALLLLEIALACGVLASAGILTAGAPARGVVEAQIAAQAAADRPAPYFGMVETGDLMIHLEIVPGIAGENEFIIAPLLLDGTPILDATRVRLRFEYLDAPLGRSEARALHMGDGIYTVTSANLSAAGRWRIRATIARSGAYDTVVDFEADIPAP